MINRDYELIRSKRRTLSICVDQEGALVVRAPMRLPIGEIEAFLERKRSWIEEKQQAAKSRERFELRDEAQMPFAGGLITVRLFDGKSAFEEPETLFLPNTGDIYEHARSWRMQRAKEWLMPRVAYWSELTGITPGKVSFGHARKRWGSMNSKGTMRLNTALVHCPMELCDYVIVHELCHIPHPNHSPAFHAAVRSYLPNADELRRKLKALGYLTTLLDKP